MDTNYDSHAYWLSQALSHSASNSNVRAIGRSYAIMTMHIQLRLAPKPTKFSEHINAN